MTFRPESRASAPAVPLLVSLPRTLAISPLVAALAAILLVLIAPPAFFLLNVSLHETLPDGSLGDFTLRFYEQLVTGRFFLESLRNTLIYAFGSAVTVVSVSKGPLLTFSSPRLPASRRSPDGPARPDKTYPTASLATRGKSPLPLVASGGGNPGS